ncbi:MULTISPECIES: hypothetical protein [Paenibacillus]|uniref:hypothetical protein n=1 Tax=Paenibacillus illinoisensis TaxID=59845 RepID=UPI001C8F121B|nr:MULTISPECIES: hypothetical protein [Paenibacillus]MBY0219087.1 hypothetical protein [Paenibacillus illinoisensis]WJH29676.1 hypothetical protein N6H13_02535 [Paenibacillus sp. CC-CFT742]
MSQVRLSIPVGMLVENVLTSGEPIEVIINRLRRRDLAPLLSKIKEPTMDVEERLQTAEEAAEDWAEALRSGYEFKFLHINGLKRVLDFRFDRKIDRDYSQEELTLRHIRLSTQQIELLRMLIGRQWEVIEEENNEAGAVLSTDILVGIKLKYQ